MFGNARSARFSPARASNRVACRQSPEIYSRLALSDAQQAYDQTIGRFPA